MSESTTSTHREDIAAAECSESAECPACFESDLLDLPSFPHTVCSKCGYVIGTDTEVPDTSATGDATGTGEEESWSEYYAVTNSTEKQVASALTKLEDLGDELLLSVATREKIAQVYESAAVDNLTDGRPTQLIVAASICIGSREAEVPRPSDRVAQAADLSAGRVKQANRLFQEELGRGYTGDSSARYVPYLCDDLNVDSSVKDRAIEVIELLEENSGQQEVHPAGVAGAAIYVAADGALSQREVAAAAGVTKETVRLRVADLREVITE